MYNRLKQILLEGLNTGGSSKLTGFRLGKMTKARSWDVNRLVRVGNRIQKRNPGKFKEPAIERYIAGIDSGMELKNSVRKYTKNN